MLKLWRFSENPNDGFIKQVQSKATVFTSGYLIFFLAFRGTNLSTSLFCIHKMEHKAFRFVQHAPILYDALGTVCRYTAIIFKIFRSEICRFGKVSHYLSTQFIYVWKKMNRVGVRACYGNDRYALWMKATLPIPAYIHSSLTNILFHWCYILLLSSLFFKMCSSVSTSNFKFLPDVSGVEGW